MAGSYPNGAAPNGASSTTSPVSADLSAAYSVLSSAPVTMTSISIDLPAAYLVRVSVASNLAAAYSIRSQASADLLVSYTISGSSSGPMLVEPHFTPSLARTVGVLPAIRAFEVGAFWDLSDPKKPRGSKDPTSTIDITFDWTKWLADMGSPALASVVFTLQGAQDGGGSFAEAGKTTVFVGASVGAVKEVAITCRVATASTPPRTDERTVYLDLENQ